MVCRETEDLRLEIAKAGALREFQRRLKTAKGSVLLPWNRRAERRSAAKQYLANVLGAEIRSLVDVPVLDPNLDIEEFAKDAIQRARELADNPAVERLISDEGDMLVTPFRDSYLEALMLQRRMLAWCQPARPRNRRLDQEAAVDPEDSIVESNEIPSSATEPPPVTPPSKIHQAQVEKALPSIPREALLKIERAETEALEQYYTDTTQYAPINAQFSFADDSILLVMGRILEHVRIFGEELLDAYLSQYLEYAPADLLTNDALLRCIGERVLTGTDSRWNGYWRILVLEPGRRRAGFSLAMATGEIDKHPEFEPWCYPEIERWADFVKQMAEPGSEVKRLNALYAATMNEVLQNKLRKYQTLAISRLPVTTLPATAQPGIPVPSSAVADTLPVDGIDRFAVEPGNPESVEDGGEHRLQRQEPAASDVTQEEIKDGRPDRRAFMAPRIVPTPGQPTLNGVAENIAEKERTRPGPKTDRETALQVLRVVNSIAGSGPWKSRLDDVCEALDDQNVVYPKTWSTRDPAILNWIDAATTERDLAKKAIDHHLKIARS